MRRWNSRSIWMAAAPFTGTMIGALIWALNGGDTVIAKTPRASNSSIATSATQVVSADTQGLASRDIGRPPQLERLRTLVAKISAESRGISQGGDGEGSAELAASQLTHEELATLESWALDPNQDGDSRQAALFLLSEAGTSAVGQLAAIAREPIPEAAFQAAEPHSESDYRRSLELSLRVSALEAMDILSIDEPSLIRESMGQILTVQSDPTVRFLAQVSMAGTAEGKPGKLQRMVDRLTTGKTE